MPETIPLADRLADAARVAVLNERPALEHPAAAAPEQLVRVALARAGVAPGPPILPPPSLDRATLAARDLRGRLLAAEAQALEATGGHAAADRLVRRSLAVAARDEVARNALTARLYERGLVRLGDVSWHAERQARHAPRWGTWCRWIGPYWDGRPLDGRRILVLGDEGLGDRLWRARYFAWLADEMGGRVISWSGPALARLLRRTPGVAASVSPSRVSPGVAGADTWILPSGLADVYGETHETIPTAPYVFADPALVEHWRPYVIGGRVAVGLNWAGSPDSYTEGRAMRLADFAPLLGVPGVRWLALQVGESARERTCAGQDPIRLGPQLRDLADAAAVVAQLDLVITSDTSVAHLGGAMGRPTWLLLHAGHNYLWGRAPYVDVEAHVRRTWYPTLRVFRALPGEGWGPVVRRVADALRRLVAERGAA